MVINSDESADFFIVNFVFDMEDVFNSAKDAEGFI